VEVAARLREQLRGSDTVARIGGDEFTVLCEGVAGVEAAMALAERLAGALAVPFELAAGEARITAAVGVAVGRRGEAGGELLRRADAAMYEAKRAGTGGAALAG